MPNVVYGRGKGAVVNEFKMRGDGELELLIMVTSDFVKKHFFCRQFFELGICSSFTQRTLLMMFFRSSKKHDNLIRLESKGVCCWLFVVFSGDFSFHLIKLNYGSTVEFFGERFFL